MVSGPKKDNTPRYSQGFSFIHLLVITGLIILGGIIIFPKISPVLTEKAGQQLEEIASTKISRQLAVDNVKKLPEVQEYLKDVPNGRVEVDNELEGEYNVHVYEVKDGHTATFNWYRVSIKSGEIRPEFSAESKTGTISGKLCYPSEVLPKGRLEVKNISTGKIDYEDYPGSENGGSDTYSFQLEEGDYHIRYKVADNLIGYSTTVCPTGQEETCGDTKQRVSRKAEVKVGETISGYDLCDYYYKDSGAPKF